MTIYIHCSLNIPTNIKGKMVLFTKKSFVVYAWVKCKSFILLCKKSEVKIIEHYTNILHNRSEVTMNCQMWTACNLFIIMYNYIELLQNSFKF